MNHFKLLEREGRELCKPEEHPVECTLRWMAAFSEQGYWDFSTRKFFYDRVTGAVPEPKKEEWLIAYALKDQEIEVRRQNLLRQAGLDESMSPWAVLLQQKDELNHLELSIGLFDLVQSQIQDLKGTPSPQLLKFKDLAVEMEPRKLKLIEIRKSIEALEKPKGQPQL